MKNKKIGIYVHIPFCKQKCYYCDFVSYCNKDNLIYDYVKAVKKEIRLQNIQSQITTIYIGGGTPTTLEPDQMDRLITSLKENFDFSTVREFTVEAGRPDSITEEKLKTLKKHNVSRISLIPRR